MEGSLIKKILIGCGVFIFILIVIVVIITTTRQPATQNKLTFPKEPVTLTYWRLFDDEDIFKPLLEAYKQEHPNVTINYVKKEYETYEEDLLNALAAGTGPDLFVLKSDWLPKHLDKLIPAPEGINFIKQNKYEPKKDLATQFKEVFVKAAYSDLVFDGKVYGIPLYMDSLALYYNPILFEEALEKHSQIINEKARLTENESEQEKLSQEKQRISQLLSAPPQNWTDFIDVVKLLTEKDSKGNIKKSGVAMGTSKNISRAPEILSLLMLQNNTQMITIDKKSAAFNLPIKKTDGSFVYPGTSALDFYTSFARPNKETYTWNSTFPEAVIAFGEGKTAMMINYSYYAPILKKQYPNLKFEIAPMPQIKGVIDRIDYAYFWPEVVSKNTKYPQVAWDFLAFISNRDNAREYYQATQKPPARLDFAKEAAGEELKDISGLSVYNAQALTAISWYKGEEPKKIDEVFRIMIEDVVARGQDLQTSINAAAASVTNILGQAEPLIEKEKKEP